MLLDALCVPGPKRVRGAAAVYQARRGLLQGLDQHPAGEVCVKSSATQQQILENL